MKFAVAALLVAFLAQAIDANVEGQTTTGSLAALLTAKNDGDCLARTQRMLEKCGDACAEALTAFLEEEDKAEKSPAVDEVVPAVASAVDEVVPAAVSPVDEVVPDVASAVDEVVPDVASAVDEAIPAAVSPVDEVVPAVASPVDEAAMAAVAAAAAEHRQQAKAARKKAKLAGNVVGAMDGLDQLSAAAEAMIANALGGMAEEKLAKYAADMSLDELLDTVEGAQTAVSQQSLTLAGRITKLTNMPLMTKGCAKDLVASAHEMSGSLEGVPDRAAQIVAEGTAVYNQCFALTDPELQEDCKAKLVPIALRAAKLTKDVNDDTPATNEILVNLRAALMDCRKNGIH